MNERGSTTRLLFAFALCCATTASVRAQQPGIQFPPQPGVYGQPGAYGAPPFGTGVNPGAANIAPSLGAPTPTFDPFAASNTIRPQGSNMFNQPGGFFSGNSVFGGQPTTAPNVGTNWFGQPAPNYAQPPLGFGQPPPAPAPYGANPYGASPYGAQPYGATPYYNGTVFGDPNQYQVGPAQRVVQDIGFSYTWVSGDEMTADVDISDIEAHATFMLANLLALGPPLYVTPGGVFHLWAGPAGIPADLPPKAYSAFVDFAYRTNPELVLGGDINFRIGAYTDFDTFNWDSIRYQGQGIGLLRLTPQLTAKFGVRYIDRLRYKLFPAVGVMWQPTPQLKLDIFFPQPKLAMYLSNLGNAELWAYAAAEYGGGSWTIQRANGASDRIDINDIRVMGGIEWFASGGVHGFVEGGYVFQREVLYFNFADQFNPPDTFMLRGGLSY